MSDKPPSNAAVFEQVYTSARALLNRSHGDLGVVCETAGFPKEIQPELDRLNSYQTLESLPADSPQRHPPAYTLSLRSTQGAYYTVSRTVFAGADHTGRTNPLAHHFATPADAIGNDLSPADLLNSLRSHFLSRWEGEPRRLEQPLDLTVARRLSAGSQFPSSAWRQLVSTSRVAEILGYFAESMTSGVASANASVVFVIPSNIGDGVLDLLVDLLAVLPASTAIAITVRTHVVSPPSISGQCRVMFTYPNTEFLIQSRRRQDADRPVIIDLVESVSSELQFTDYGKHIERAVKVEDSTREIGSLVAFRAEMGIVNEGGVAPFSDYVFLQRLLRSSEPLRDINTMLPHLRNVSMASRTAEVELAAILSKNIDDHFRTRRGDCDWHALATLAFTPGVPPKPQQLAGKAIEKCIARALPAIFDHPCLVGPSAGRILLWLQKCVGRKEVVSTLIDDVVSKPTPQGIECLRRTFRELKPAATPEDLAQWASLLQTANGVHISQLRNAIAEFAVVKIESGTTKPLELIEATQKLVGQCNESERNEILFQLLEASSKSDQLGEFVRFVNETSGSDRDFIFGYDVARHSNVVRAAIHAILNAKRPLSIRASPNEAVHPKPKIVTDRPVSQKRNRRGNGSDLRALMSWCMRCLMLLSFFTVLAFFVFRLEIKAMPAIDTFFHFRKWIALRPVQLPSWFQRLGLLAYPLAALLSGVMYVRVSLNKDISRITYSRWCLWTAIILMLTGFSLTLFSGFQWLRQ